MGKRNSGQIKYSQKNRKHKQQDPDYAVPHTKSVAPRFFNKDTKYSWLMFVICNSTTYVIIY